MTTSQALHNHLVSLSRKKAHPRKHGGKKPARVVDLVKVVLRCAPTSKHHSTTVRPATEESTPTPSHQDSFYPQLHQQLTQEIQEIQEKRVQVRQRQVEFWGLYKYALEKVSNLSDLRDAPDAILPGNFPDAPKKIKPSSSKSEDKPAAEETNI
ncbi:expressed unknown protein [Seminavis robusta]|uniref:Uncharacterized protein n=1 Tax=Seminavis robusta TaxID=568900 RepID=A0A9N8D8X5_9STRA|nr:expressed unknown protein [Seminavis robusta]|eukprot:Sro4_g003690.1 n/a (154) ;mRNA; f:222528-222989